MSNFENIEYQLSNGLRYPLVGGTGRRCFDGPSFHSENCPKMRRLPPVGCSLLLGAIWIDKLATIRIFVIVVYISLLSSVFDLNTRISKIIVPVATSIYNQMPHNK